MRCEICDREPIRRADGYGWCVGFRPRLPLSVWLSESSPLAVPKAVRIFTCGDEICIWRARHHGVPGVKYASEERAA